MRPFGIKICYFWERQLTYGDIGEKVSKNIVTRKEMDGSIKI